MYGLRFIKTKVHIVSQRAEIRYWKAMARTMWASQLRVLLPLGPGPAEEDLFHFDYFHGDLDFDITAPDDRFLPLPPEVRNIICQMLLLQPHEIMRWAVEKSHSHTTIHQRTYEKLLAFLVFAER